MVIMIVTQGEASDVNAFFTNTHLHLWTLLEYPSYFNIKRHILIGLPHWLRRGVTTLVT